MRSVMWSVVSVLDMSGTGSSRIQPANDLSYTRPAGCPPRCSAWVTGILDGVKDLSACKLVRVRAGML